MFDKGPRTIVDYHQSMLADSARTESLQKAIAAAVSPGDLVLDLGCGTGILSFFALRAGARRVYAVELGRVIELAKTISAANDFGSDIVFLRKEFSEVELPERVDLLITETIGNFGLEEGILGTVIEARRRWLKPEGSIIPQALELAVAPVEAPGISRHLEIWTEDLHGLDFSRVRPFAINNPAWIKLDPSSFLSESQTLARVDLARAESDEVRGEASFVVGRAGTVHGIGGWFLADLFEGFSLSNAPSAEASSWMQAFFPLERALCVAEGDELTIVIHAMANGAVWRWQVTHCQREAPATTLTLDHSTFFGSLLSPAELLPRSLGRDLEPEDGEID